MSACRYAITFKQSIAGMARSYKNNTQHARQQQKRIISKNTHATGACHDREFLKSRLHSKMDNPKFASPTPHVMD